MILSSLSNIRFLILFLLQTKPFFSGFQFQQGLCLNGPVERLVGRLYWHINYQIYEKKLGKNNSRVKFQLRISLKNISVLFGIPFFFNYNGRKTSTGTKEHI